MIWPWAALLGFLAFSLLTIRTMTIFSLSWSRDVWLCFLPVGAGILWLAWREPALALLALSVAAQWRGPGQMASVIVWGGVLASWGLVATLPAPMRPAFGWAFAGVAAVHVLTVAIQVAVSRRWMVSGRLGQRTYSAGALAVTLPFLWPWGMPIGLVALSAHQSWLAVLATMAALGMLAPWTLWISGVLALAVFVAIVQTALVPQDHVRPAAESTWLDRWTTRGSSIDSLRARMLQWRVLLAHLTWRGTGPGSGQRTLARSQAPEAGHAHCEPLEHVVEYGLLGFLAICAVAARVIPHLRVGDPWSAAAVAGAILMLGSPAARLPQIGGVWWITVAMVATR